MPKHPEITAVLVTRGDQDLTEVLDSIPWPTIVWDNSVEFDVSVFGRYMGIIRARGDVIYVQDDDCVLPPESHEAFVEAYEPGVITANMPERFRHDFYIDHCLVGFGAIFDKKLTDVLLRFEKMHNQQLHDPEWRAWYHRVSDIVFTLLNERKLLDLPVANLGWAEAPNRMWKQAQHVGERTAMLDLVRRVRDDGW